MGIEDLRRIATKGKSVWHPNIPTTDTKQNRKGDGSEHSEQVTVARYLDLLGVLYFAVPSGELRHISIAMRLKAEGVKQGVCDLIILEPRGSYHGLLLEMKKASVRPVRLPLWGEGSTVEGWKASGLSDEQWEFCKDARRRGYFVRVGYGALHAKEIIDGYLKL